MANYFTDRIVEFPGRVKLTAVSGQTDVYDMERAEGAVTDDGTSFNAATFNQVAQNIIDLIPPVSKFYAGTCGTAQSTQTKVVECSGFTLEAGATVAVYFANGNTYSGTTNLNVNGTGAVPIQNAAGETATNAAGLWASGGVVAFQYHNGAWIPLNPRRTPERVTGTNGSILAYGNCVGWYDPATRSVRLSFAFSSGTNNIGQGTEIFNIPASYRPADSVSGAILMYTAGSTFAGGGCIVDANGKLYQNLTSQGRQGYGSIEYYI